MDVILIEVKSEHRCHTCGKPILPGELAVKSRRPFSNCCATLTDTAYHHKDCWRSHKGASKRKWER